MDLQTSQRKRTNKLIVSDIDWWPSDAQDPLLFTCYSSAAVRTFTFQCQFLLRKTGSVFKHGGALLKEAQSSWKVSLLCTSKTGNRSSSGL